MKIKLLETGYFKADGGAMFSVVPKSLWVRNYPDMENNLCPVASRSLLIEKEKRIIVVDCGIGTKHDEKYLSHHHLFGEDTLLKSLATNGIMPENVTDVILTHLHFDHCGGATYYDKTGRAVPTFPNANYWVTPEQWTNYLNPNIREADSYFPDNVLPIYELGRLKFITPTTSFFPEMSFFISNGHTVGLIVPIIQYKGKTLVFAGDMIPTAVNIPLKWLASYDIAPLISLAEKEPFMERAVNENYTLIFQHDYYRECATLERTVRGIKMKENFAFLERF